MSRSLHTQKLSLRAERRFAHLRSSRREDGALVSGCPSVAPLRHEMRLPRIAAARPVPGAILPVTPADVRDWLGAFGPAAVYRLRSVRLLGVPVKTARGILFGEYSLSGEIVLYAVPQTPWRLPFALSTGDADLFRRYGAAVEVRQEARETLVGWDLGLLKAFYRWEVLAHELGHHAVQTRKCLRRAAARRADHESAARLFANRARRRQTRGAVPAE